MEENQKIKVLELEHISVLREFHKKEELLENKETILTILSRVLYGDDFKKLPTHKPTEIQADYERYKAEESSKAEESYQYTPNSKEEQRENGIAEDGRKIGDRVYNGLEKEHWVCDRLKDDDKFFKLFEEFLQKIYKCSFEKIVKERIKVCVCYIVGYFKNIGEKHETYVGKLAQFCRVIKEKIGNCAGCCERYIQKSVQWFKWFKSSCKESDAWAEKENAKHRDWAELVLKVQEFIASKKSQGFFAEP